MKKGIKNLFKVIGVAAAAAGAYYYLNEENEDGQKNGEVLMKTVRKYIPLYGSAEEEIVVDAEEAFETEEKDEFTPLAETLTEASDNQSEEEEVFINEEN